MQRFRAWMTAGFLVSSLAGWGGVAAADELIEPVGSPGLQVAAYDVIIVPRSGRGAPRVLTERGWRNLTPQNARSRSFVRRDPTPFRERQFNPYGYRPYASRDVRPTPYQRWTGYDGYRRSNAQRAY